MSAASKYAKKEPDNSLGGLLVVSVLTPCAIHRLPSPTYPPGEHVSQACIQAPPE